jgi:predicted ABC-type transport system involved in lysophospholipase L1 biosynthesis ATPase subunit
MPSPAAGDVAVIEIKELSKSYGGLRPLRIKELTVGAHERVALLGLDKPMAEVFVNLVTGATLPDAGEVRLFGRDTASVADSAEWLALVDRFGIVSARAILLEPLTVLQNLAMPFTLDIDSLPEGIVLRARQLAEDVGLAEALLPRRVSDLNSVDRLRLRVARALALDPSILVLEHASAELPPDAGVAMAADIASAAMRRGCALVALTTDHQFAAAGASRVLTHEPASGRLSPGGRNWLGRILPGRFLLYT